MGLTTNISVHDIESIALDRHYFDGTFPFHVLKLHLRDAEGGMFDIQLFSKEPLEIEDKTAQILAYPWGATE